MSSILVVDDMAIFRDPIAASLRLAGYTTLMAANGKEALEAMRKGRVDLVLLDIAMPVMDGLAFLRAMRADAALASTPVVLLTAVADRQHIVEAAKLGAKEYLLKSRFSLGELLERVKKHLEQTASAALTPGASVASSTTHNGQPTTEIPALLTREISMKRAASALEGKTLSGVVAQVVALTANPRGDASDLSNLIAKDAMLSARVLHAANSAAYASSRGPVSTIPEAVRNIGSSTVRSLAAAMGVFEAMPPSAPDGFNPIRCWEHSFAVALLCERLVSSATPEKAGTAYLVGLCHDLGEIMFHISFAAEFRQVLEMQSRTGRRRAELEKTMLGMTHSELVQAIFQHIGLPDDIREPIRVFHESAHARPVPSGNALADVLRIADTYANGMLLASSAQAVVGSLARALCHSATGADNPPAPDSLKLRGEISALTGLLARLSPDEEKKLLAPLFPRRPLRVWVARDSLLSNFDPITLAIQSMAHVQMQPRLPAADEWEQIEALVVLISETPAGGLSMQELQQALAARRRMPLPTLYLAAKSRTAATAAPQGVEVATYPLPLERLAGFVGKAAASAKPAVAA